MVIKNKDKEVNIMEQKIVLKQYTCERCNHTWLPRTFERPRICPRCKSAWWDTVKTKVSKIEK